VRRINRNCQKPAGLNPRVLAKHLCNRQPTTFQRYVIRKRHGSTRSTPGANRSDGMILGVAQMNIAGDAILRPRFCAHTACRAAFTICVSCDRGQRYCSPECRLEVRRRQRHEANRRYRQSKPGRESHRLCQQRYRNRARQPAVTDQPIAPITSGAAPDPPTVGQCAICGRRSPWIDPFPTIPRQLRRSKLLSHGITTHFSAF